MDYISIAGVKPYDGRYEFDLDGSALTTREWGWIKRLTGYLPLTVDDGLAGGDPEIFAVFAVLALRRAGRVVDRDVGDVFERIIDSPFETTIRIESTDLDAEEDEAGPPPQRSTSSADTSGPDSRTSSETSDETPTGSGTLDSDTSELRSLRSAS